MRIFTGIVMQLISTVGVLFFFGFLIAILRRIFCAITGKAGPKILLATGIIGTPIHELSHALMCIIFLHRINEIRLFAPDSSTGRLGYVDHSYNKRNLYQQIGNFFIGVAPILFGTSLIVLLMYLLVPSAFFTVSRSALGLPVGASLPIGEFLGFFFSSLWSVLCTLGDIKGWIFLILAILIASHMELSGADIKGGLFGLFLILVIYIPISVIIGLVSPTGFTALTRALSSFGIVFAALLSISVIFLFVMVAFALIVKIILSLIHR